MKFGAKTNLELVKEIEQHLEEINKNIVALKVREEMLIIACDEAKRR
jgi:hypothetical protein